MDPFRTIVKIKKSSFSINYNSHIMLLGSCFTENIGQKLNENKFTTFSNPFGVLYNPASICQSIKMLLDKQQLKDTDLSLHNNLWFSYSHDTSFSNTDKKKCLNNINETLQSAKSFLNHTDFLILTFGTAWIYELSKTRIVVANCHKIPDKQFTRRLLSVEEIVTHYQPIIERLKGVNIIFTISPVRHWKDGAEQNQISKATLVLAINELVKANGNTTYFPSYEIVMDELRDYRFYSADMLHVNNIAIDYIWQRFGEVYFKNGTIQFLESIDKIVRARKHRLLLNEPSETRKFASGMLEKIVVINRSWPDIDLSEEMEYFKSLI